MKSKILGVVAVALAVVSVLLSVLVLINSAGIADKNNDSGTQEELKVIKRIYELDISYENEAKKTESDEDLAELNKRYANLWKSEADRYLEKLKKYYAEVKYNDEFCIDFFGEEKIEDMFNKLIASQEDWEEYYENQTSFYKKYLAANHVADTDYSLEYYKYSMNLYRDRAIELYKMCSDNFIEVFPL
ncbi:MAG: hypothetical protein ACI3YE_08615 [Candidatus Avispirillum sp.]